MAHFQAGEGAGAAVFAHQNPSAFAAAPANFFEHGIRPFPGSPWDGADFCVDDWHVLLIASLAGAFEGEPPISRKDGVAQLEQESFELYLDESRITDVEKTVIKRQRSGLLNDNGTLIPIHDGWFQQTGAFYGPGELAVGSHTFSATWVHDMYGAFPIPPITFNIDASGTGSCLW